MSWPHDVKITRPGDAPGIQDGQSGAWAPGADAPVTLYDAKGDLQQRIRQLRKDDAGDVTLQSDADLFLADETDLWVLRTGDAIEVVDRAAFVEITGKLVQVDHLSGRLFVSDLTVRPLIRVVPDDRAIRKAAANKDRTV